MTKVDLLLEMFLFLRNSYQTPPTENTGGAGDIQYSSVLTNGKLPSDASVIPGIVKQMFDILEAPNAEHNMKVNSNGGLERGQLAEERKSWRKNHPYGFIAKPETESDGSVNLMCWKCFIPSKEGTDWEGGHYPLSLQFSEDYPDNSPSCKFPHGFLHPNVYPFGLVCLSIIWKPAITVKQILVSIRDLLDNPNPSSSANHDINILYLKMQVERHLVRRLDS
ncbi:LOW QUALITY PROTEIN: SUMO-conjugating enzyme SCE1-like [Arachis stenosperma]|uniref:LOW QUALITY PROTEIN: SUMO-conjugating enzyme SCE1-like n=1 Tax=Arachis stenosperma TaxID=217475 RepID=UPI0025ABD2DD|nr:LOW QUALITY PROTEIN: SUMO-conjugating enzyme SCE1-like [Arachis stenosperma]